MKYIIILTLITIPFFFMNCEKADDIQRGKTLLFPVGRSDFNNTNIKVSIGNQAYTPETFYDSCGGYWVRIPKIDNPDNKLINFRITRKSGNLEFFPEVQGDSRWTSSSFYIDANNAAIAAKASELTAGLIKNVDKARAIQQYISRNIELRQYKDSFLDKASRTYQLKYGTCMNFSRLYVALCRAANVPARTIWGVVYGYNNDNVYDYHHQWAEIQDEEGYWHPADFNYTTNFNLNDIRYLDLIYAAEENEVILNRDSSTLMLRNLKYYNNYPVTLDARLGFELQSDNRPDSMVVKYSY